MGSPTQPVTRAELTRAWSEALCRPAGVPIPCSSVEGCTGESEAWFQEVFDFAPVGMMLSRLDSTVTKTNSALAEILQYPASALAGHDVAELFHPDDAALLRASYQGLVLQS